MELEKIRKEIDGLDEELVRILAKRIGLIPMVAEYKKKNNVERKDPSREEEIIKAKRELAKEFGVDPDLVEDLFRRIIEESHRIEKDIMGK